MKRSIYCRWMVLLPVFCASLTLAADRKPAARESVDKVPYPDVVVGERRITAKIPQIQDMLGSLPEEVAMVDRRWMSIDGDLDPAKKFRELMDASGLGTRETQFFSNKPVMQSKAVAIGLSHGRISRVVLITGEKYTFDEANKLLQQFRLPRGRAEDGPARGAYGSLTRDDVTYYARGVGRWQNNIPAKVKKVFNQFGQAQVEQVAPARVESGPTAFVFEVDGRDWLLMQFCRKEFFKDAKAGRIVEKMTEMEARAALLSYPLRVQKDGSRSTLRWYRTEITSVRYAGDLDDDEVSDLEVKAESVLYCTAVVTDGFVTSVEWAN